MNAPIANVVLPKTMEKLILGADCGLLVGVDWPDSLKEIKFYAIRCEYCSRGYNEPLDGVLWPPYLQKLSMGDDFNQPVERAVWPSSLRELTFEYHFDQPVVGMQWPASLK